MRTLIVFTLITYVAIIHCFVLYNSYCVCTAIWQTNASVGGCVTGTQAISHINWLTHQA